MAPLIRAEQRRDCCLGQGVVKPSPIPLIVAGATINPKDVRSP
jgi:hypothetical protein